MSKIEWTHRPGTKSEVLNPTTGCDKVSPGCRGCYAETMHRRLTGMGQPKYQQPFLGHVRYWPDELAKPFRWKKPRTVFLNSMSDIFHKDITVRQIAEIYAMMFLTPQHTYIVLTKRADRAYYVLTSVEFFEEYHKACNRLHDKCIQNLEQAMYQEIELESMWPLRNVWQGVSVENQDTLDDRGRWITKTPAHIRVISYEPALGPIDLRSLKGNAGSYYQILEPITGCGDSDRGRIDWVIAGGESGHSARPPHPDWFRQVRDQCKAAGVSFFFKQNGEWAIDSHVSFNGPFSITRVPHRIVDIDGNSWPYVDIYDPGEDNCPLTKEDNAYWMAKVGKHQSGNLLDGVQHLEFPA